MACTTERRASASYAQRMARVKNTEHSLRSENLPFDIDVWYPRLAKHTAATTFLPLTRREALAIMSYHDATWRHAKPRMARDDVRVLEALEARIDEELQTNAAFTSTGAFMRLCGRSPKDGEPLDRTRVMRRFEAELDRVVREQGLPADDPNTALNAIARVSWLRVSTGAEAMSLLLTSERVYSDMHDWIRYGEPEQLCFRTWNPSFALDFEFRCFVSEDRLTAISQYDTYAVYPHLAPLKQRIESAIVEEWSKVHVHVGLSTYCCDFAFIPSSCASGAAGDSSKDQEAADRAVLIELSPFLPCTGPALFSWTADERLLLGNVNGNGSCHRQQREQAAGTALEGKAKTEAKCESKGAAAAASLATPLEFRILTTSRYEREQLADLVDVNWYERWREKVRPFRDVYAEATPPLSRPVLKPSSGGWVGCFRRCVGGRTRGSGEAETKEDRDCEEQGTAAAASTTLLFVYGTLKRGFHWNPKYLSHGGSRFVSTARTSDAFPLVVGESGVPYLLGDLVGQGSPVVGELWSISQDTLAGLDEYEGLGKGYYERRAITVVRGMAAGAVATTTAGDLSSSSNGGNDVGEQAFVYLRCKSSPALRQRPFLHEYDKETHLVHYNAIRHILVKQQVYLGESNDNQDA